MEAEEIYQIGVSTVNAGYYDTGIEWLELARQRIKSPQQNIPLSQEMKMIDVTIRDAKKIHDHFLDKSSVEVLSGLVRCNRLPFDEKLRRKKKYKAAKKNRERVKRPKNYFPLFAVWEFFCGRLLMENLSLLSH